MQYFPYAVAQREIYFEKLCEIVSSQCSASRADCFMVMTALTDVLKDQLLEGNIVRIKD